MALATIQRRNWMFSLIEFWKVLLFEDVINILQVRKSIVQFIEFFTSASIYFTALPKKHDGYIFVLNYQIKNCTSNFRKFQKVFFFIISSFV